MNEITNSCFEWGANDEAHDSYVYVCLSPPIHSPTKFHVDDDNLTVVMMSLSTMTTTTPPSLLQVYKLHRKEARFNKNQGMKVMSRARKLYTG